MPRMLISYRREDTAPYAGRLYDRLSERFGSDAVFVDVDTIDPGEDYVDKIERAISEADVLLALIGPRWAEITDVAGTRRLADPTDFVRVEIGTALERGMRVIPVLVGGALVPRAEELPDDLSALSRRQAYGISDMRFHSDVDDLIRFLHSLDATSLLDLEPDPKARPVVTGRGTSTDVQACETQLKELLRTPWLEGNLLWSLGMLTVGLYYFFVSATVVQRVGELLRFADREHDDRTCARLELPNVRKLVPGSLVHGVGWALGIGFVYLIVVKPSAYVHWKDELIASAALAFWVGTAWLLSWLWASTRTLTSEFAAARESLPESWLSDQDVGRWQAIHVQKIVALLLMFAFEIYLLLMLERALVDGMDRAVSLDIVYRYVLMMIALPATLMQGFHCLVKDMVWKLLHHVNGTLVLHCQRPWHARALRASWFWLWMYTNAAVAAYAFYLVHEPAFALILD